MKYLSALFLLGCLTACAGAAPSTATFATVTPQPAAVIIDGTAEATPSPVVLVDWVSPDGRIHLQVPQDWASESHAEAGRGLWIWNAPGQRGLISLLLVATPSQLDVSAQEQLLRDSLAQLDATLLGDIVTDNQGIMRAEAQGVGLNREGVDIPLWLQVSVQQFDDSVAVLVMSVPEQDTATIVAAVPTLQSSLAIAPLPTATALPTATPAPRTQDAFDRDEGRWFVGDDVRRAMTIQDGVYRMYLRMADSYYLSAPAEAARTDQHIEVTAQFEGAARIGTALRFSQRADGTRDYVVCWISPLQRFGCFRSEADMWVAIQDVTESTVIVPDGPNRMEFAVQGTSYELWVNGVLLTQFEYDIETAGVPGLYVETFDVAAGGIFDDVETS